MTQRTCILEQASKCSKKKELSHLRLFDHDNIQGVTMRGSKRLCFGVGASGTRSGLYPGLRSWMLARAQVGQVLPLSSLIDTEGVKVSRLA